MNLPVSLVIARRYAQASKSGKFVGLISLFSKAGIAIGVMALIIVISVMDGFEGVLKQRILSTVPHITLQKNSSDSVSYPELATLVDASVHIKQALPLTETTAIVQMPNDLQGVMVQGIAGKEYIPLGVKNVLVNGDWDTFFDTEYGLIIGRFLALEKGLSIGDKVRVIVSGASSYTPLGRMPSQRTFKIVGLFETESEIDQQMVFAKSANLNRLLKKSPEYFQSIRLVLDDPFEAITLIRDLDEKGMTNGLTVQSWHRTHGKLFDAVKMEKTMMWLMLSLIVGVAAFNIVSALVMMVTQKQGEVAILRTLGLTRSNVAKIFTAQGILNGFVGASWGFVLGTGIALLINPFMAATGINILGVPGLGLPIEYSVAKAVGIVIISIVLAFAASVYPARRAAKLMPADILRYE